MGRIERKPANTRTVQRQGEGVVPFRYPCIVGQTKVTLEMGDLARTQQRRSLGQFLDNALLVKPSAPVGATDAHESLPSAFWVS